MVAGHVTSTVIRVDVGCDAADRCSSVGGDPFARLPKKDGNRGVFVDCRTVKEKEEGQEGYLQVERVEVG